MMEFALDNSGNEIRICDNGPAVRDAIGRRVAATPRRVGVFTLRRLHR